MAVVDSSVVVTLVFVDGLLKPHSPGSLREPARTYMLPHNWCTLPLSFGLLMGICSRISIHRSATDTSQAPWGGHSVFPNIYRDMRHPRKYKKGINIVFGFTVGGQLQQRNSTANH